MEDGVGHLFDHIDDLLDFPGDEDALGIVPEPILLPPLPVCGGADEVLGGEGGKKADAEFNPCDELDIEQLEWMSKFLEDSDSFSLGLTVGGIGAAAAAEKSVGERCCFRTSSPVSVLEANTNRGGGVRSDSSITTSSSSSSSTAACYFIGGEKEEKATPLPPPLSPPEPPAVPVVPGRARSKRARPATFLPHPLVVIPSLPSPADAVTAATSDPESFSESSSPAPPLPLKKKSKKRPNPYADESDLTSPPPPPAARKCAHCQIQKTPQWRAGPMGPKTLCNACGVRYKSGRLFPEYRPAASPTFVPSVHSNSHKKVVEMRIKANQNAAAATSADGCDLLDYIRRRRD